MTTVESEASELYWDPFDTEIDAHPYEIWRRMRDEAPVYRNDTYDFWALSRYVDVEGAHRDPATYSSAQGTVLELMGKGMPQSMIFMDPPEHGRLRTLVSRAFTPRRIDGLQPHIRDLCADLLDPHVGGDGFDFVQDFGAQLPSMVISELLGVPDDQREAVREAIDGTFHIEPGVGMINDVSLEARIRLWGHLEAIIADRRAHPRDDMITDLVQAEMADEDGSTRRLDDEECGNFVNLLVSAGTETVARLLGWAAMTLDAHPDQRAELAADPGLLPNAVDELLRYEAPSPVQGRWTTRAIQVHDTTIPKDSKVVLLTGSAGRDERKYPDAERFDIHRAFDNHVSFGYGIHFCIGAALARMEGRIALEEVLARFPEWQVDHDNANRLHTSTVRGWINVPVRV
ncbi:MAG TPA: cytochrome P450 [Acidimicrobiales bacterium]